MRSSLSIRSAQSQSIPSTDHVSKSRIVIIKIPSLHKLPLLHILQLLHQLFRQPNIHDKQIIMPQHDRPIRKHLRAVNQSKAPDPFLPEPSYSEDTDHPGTHAHYVSCVRLPEEPHPGLWCRLLRSIWWRLGMYSMRMALGDCLSSRKGLRCGAHVG